MTAFPQEQSTPVDHQYFQWSTSKEQTNLLHPLMTHTNRRHYYQHSEEKHFLEDNQLKSNKTMITSPLNSPPVSHIKKKQKRNGMGSNDEQNQLQTCYPFQAELTQKIDIECGGGGNNSNGPNQIAHTPTHHFTLSTVINVSVNGQTQKSLDILPSLSQQPYPNKSHDQADLHPLPSLIPYSELNFFSYLKDIDLTTLDTFILPSCPNPQDYLTVDGLLTFLMSNKNFSKQYSLQQMYNYPRTPHYRYPYQQSQTFPQQNLTDPYASSVPMETGTPVYSRQSSLPQPMTNYYSTPTPTPSFR